MSRKQSRKSKARKPVVRGPQGQLPLGPARGDLRTRGRTPRLRYVEPPSKKNGNPFFACRVPARLLAAFRRKAKPDANAAVRAFMSKVTGIPVDAEADE